MKIEIYGSNQCPNCKTALNLAESNGLSAISYKVEKDFIITDLFKKIGSRVASFPQIFIDDKYIGGLNEFISFIENKDTKDTFDNFEL